jgi:ABC-type glycerol-3-phosphate transport system substrate-binding protein
MMKKLKCLFALITLLLLVAGCGGSSSGDSGAKDESVFDPMVQTMDRASGVEDLSADRMRQLDAEIEKSE